MEQQRLRVCVVGSGTHFLSGITYYTYRLVEDLAQTHDVSLILMRQLLPTCLYPGRSRVGTRLDRLRPADDVPVFDGVDWYGVPSLARAMRFLVRQHPDVIVFQWWTGTVLHLYLVLELVARLRGARVIVEFHEMLDPAELGMPLVGRYVAAIAPLVLRLASGFVVHSAFDRDALTERYGLSGRPIAVIPHGPYDQFSDVDMAPRPEASGLKPVEVLYFGVIRPYKGLEDLIDAFGMLPDADIKNYHLTVVGETWEGWTLPAERIAQHRYHDQITFVNRYVRDEEVQTFFAAADVVALPYHRSSASGPLNIAMSHGLPIITTSVGGLVEATTGYQGVTLVPPQNPVALRDALLRIRQIRGKRFETPHSWQRIAGQFGTLFSEIMRPASPDTHRVKVSSRAATVKRSEPPTLHFRPVRLLEVEISEPLPAVASVVEETGQQYEDALALVRLHTQPLGLIPIHLGTQGISPTEYARQITDALSDHIATHLQQDNLPAVTTFGAQGISVTGRPLCLTSREAFLADPPFVSVIVPTRERPDYIARCLRSIEASDYPRNRYEIIVVDNLPKTSVTADFVANTYGNEEKVRYIREDAPGSASARNCGLAIARGEFVAFTDDDVMVDTHWLTELIHNFSAAKDVGCVTGLVVPMELETPAQVWFEEYGGFTLGGYRRQIFNLTDHRLQTPLYPYAAGIYGTGNSMAFRTSTLREIGGFDPTLGNGTPALGGVDSEVLLRTILRRHTIVYTPAAVVRHTHRRDYDGLARQLYNYGAGLTAYLFKTALQNPRLMPDMLSRLPRGLVFALSSQSGYHAKKRDDFPNELTWLERKGMLYGPLGYIRSRRHIGKHTDASFKPPKQSLRTRSWRAK